MFRDFTFPTLYPPIKSLDIDHFLFIFWYFSGSILLSFLIILPGVRGKQRIYSFLYGSFSLITGVLIIACNYSYDWSSGSIITRIPFKSGSTTSWPCKVELNIGLRGFNVSLQQLNIPKSTKESVLKYNEAFRWTWEQGIQIPHSPLSGHIVKDYYEAQMKGLPLPILWVAQTFVMDAENFRWGRHYRLAGYYAHILLWLAFPCWLLSNILIYICIKYCGYFWILTGLSLICADCVYWLLHALPPLIPLHIHFPGVVLQITLGYAFWITFYLGVLSIFVGIAIIFADAKCYNQLMAFFGIDVLQEYEDYFADPTELGIKRLSQESFEKSKNIYDPSPRSSSTSQTLSQISNNCSNVSQNYALNSKKIDTKILEKHKSGSKESYDISSSCVIDMKTTTSSKPNQKPKESKITQNINQVEASPTKVKLKPILTSPYPFSPHEIILSELIQKNQNPSLKSVDKEISNSCSILYQQVRDGVRPNSSKISLIPVLRKRGTSHSFFFKRKCSSNKIHQNASCHMTNDTFDMFNKPYSTTSPPHNYLYSSKV